MGANNTGRAHKQTSLSSWRKSGGLFHLPEENTRHPVRVLPSSCSNPKTPAKQLPPNLKLQQRPPEGLNAHPCPSPPATKQTRDLRPRDLLHPSSGFSSRIRGEQAGKDARTSSPLVLSRLQILLSAPGLLYDSCGFLALPSPSPAPQLRYAATNRPSLQEPSVSAAGRAGYP